MPYQVNPDHGYLEFRDGGGSAADVQEITTDDGAPPVLPSAGNVNILGGEGIDVTGQGPGDTVTISGEDASTINKGVAYFDPTAFTVTNGFVEIIGGTANCSVDVDANTAPGTDPVVSNAGTIIMTGAQVASGVIGANVIRTDSLAANTITIEIQRSTTAAAGDSTKNGVSHFDSANFGVSADGFVTLANDAVLTLTGDDLVAVSPTAGNINVLGGAGVTTSGAGSNLTIDLTGAGSFTTGSVIFWGSSSFDQDNANFFYDNTNNRVGIGTNVPLDTLHVVGAMELDHTATENDDHALEMVVNANGFSDVKALDIDYITGAMGVGQDEEAILVNIDESASTGGIIAGYLVLTTSEGSATVNGYETGVNINPIVQQSGTFGNADYIRNKAVDVTAALASGGAGAITAFVADNDTFTIGEPASFDELEVILTTPASGAGIAPTFEYSTGAATFATFIPADGTNGFRNTGSILWDSSTLAGWVAAASGNFEIRITRTRNTLATSPVLDEIQVAATTEFKWDKNGDVNINSLSLVVPLTVPNGGTGVATLTDHGIMLGSGAGAVTVTAAPTNGQLLIGSTGVDPVLGSLTSTGGSVTITPGAGTINLEVAASNDAVLTVTGDSGGALSPTAGNLNVYGLSGSKTSGSGSTLTVKSPPYADASASATSSLNTGEFVTGAYTRTLPASAGLADGDLIEYVCISASALVIQSVGAQKIRVGSLISAAAGTLTSTAIGDSVSLRFRASDGFWYATSVVGVWLVA